ncbi:MAG: hypothetical protein U0787_01170 [Polyangia bacterium]
MSTPARSLMLGATRSEAEDFFRRYKLEKLPLVDAQAARWAYHVARLARSQEPPRRSSPR